jgi:predicted nucleotidyltransferase component of viral defense system
MLTRDDLARIARRHGLGLGQAEREYVILCVLDALSRTQQLAVHLVFKGGTALRQLYFPDWRYSEDLDFSALPGLGTAHLSAALVDWFGRVQETWGITLSVRRLHRADGGARLRAQFVGPLAFPGLLLVDFTLDEPVILPPVQRPVLGVLFDVPQPVVRAYALEELLAEKLRSILQRGKSRDYYDVWRLLSENRSAFDHSLARETLQFKCKHKGLAWSGPDDFLVPARLLEAQRYWERDLQEQVPGLPEFSEIAAALRELLKDFLE